MNTKAASSRRTPQAPPNRSARLDAANISTALYTRWPANPGTRHAPRKSRERGPQATQRRLVSGAVRGATGASKLFPWPSSINPAKNFVPDPSAEVSQIHRHILSLNLFCNRFLDCLHSTAFSGTVKAPVVSKQRVPDGVVETI